MRRALVGAVVIASAAIAAAFARGPLAARGAAANVAVPNPASRPNGQTAVSARSRAATPGSIGAKADEPAAAASGDQGPKLENLAAYIPAQCYAKTKRADGTPRNACATCHQASREPNYVDDSDVQLEISIPRFAATNRWTNAMTPPPAVAIGERELLAYVRTDNYRGGEAVTATASYAPDCHFMPDEQGWDRDASGTATGWRSYASTPVPGMFWPTNGSAGDAYIRLPEPYRRDAGGAPSEGIYALNLAILEAMIRRADVPITATAEATLGVDLDGDGKLGVARRVAFVWPPAKDRPLHFVGQAAALDRATAGWPAAGLYPTGTEVLHSVRYLDVAGGRVRPAARMKELRYMKKLRWLTYSALDLQAKTEQREKEQNPDTLRHVYGNGERGVGTGTGWQMLGYIEDAAGTLRAQTTEETAACIGCHGGVGATTDSTFSFARKVAWTAPPRFMALAEPLRADGRGEYRTWLEAVGAGDDFGSNAEVAAKFFAKDGSLRPAMAKALARDISVLVVPSPRRALALDRAYLALVRMQSFELGRDAFAGAPQIEATLVQDAATGITSALPPAWQR